MVQTIGNTKKFSIVVWLQPDYSEIGCLYMPMPMPMPIPTPSRVYITLFPGHDRAPIPRVPGHKYDYSAQIPHFPGHKYHGLQSTDITIAEAIAGVIATERRPCT